MANFDTQPKEMTDQDLLRHLVGMAMAQIIGDAVLDRIGELIIATAIMAMETEDFHDDYEALWLEARCRGYDLPVPIPVAVAEALEESTPEAEKSEEEELDGYVKEEGGEEEEEEEE